MVGLEYTVNYLHMTLLIKDFGYIHLKILDAVI